MSKTDKTRPFRVKEREIEEVDPYGIRRHAFKFYDPMFRCCCRMCSARDADETNRFRRREARRQARNWEKEY